MLPLDGCTHGWPARRIAENGDMRSTMLSLLAATAALLLTVADGALAQSSTAETAAGSGQGQAAPSEEARTPAVTVPTPAETAGGSGQNQAAPSEEAKTPTSVKPMATEGANTAGEGTPASGDCPPAGPTDAQGADRSSEVGNKPGC
jgi:hypothetical protein